MAASETLFQVIDKKYPSSNILFGTPLAAQEQFPQSRRPTAVTVPYLDGEYDPFGDEQWPLNGRDISFKFTVKYGGPLGSDFTSVWDSFYGVLMNAGTLILVTQTTKSPTTYRYSEGKCVSMPKEQTEDYLGHCVIQATIHMTKPLTNDLTPNSWQIWDQLSPSLTWDQTGLFWDNNLDDFAITTSFVSHTITNPGSADDLAPIIQFYAPDVAGTAYAGPITFGNQDAKSRAGNNLYFSLNVSLVRGDAIQVNTGTWSVRKVSGANSGPMYNVLTLPNGQDEVMRIKRGTNRVYVQSTGVGTYNARCAANWTQRYG